MRILSAVAVASLVAAGAAQGQGGGATATASCTGLAGDVCHQAVDFFRYMAPQLGTAITGGNTTIAQGGNLGGRTLGLVPKVAISVRLNMVLGSVPNFTPTAGTPAARQLTTQNFVTPMPAVDAAVGVFKGFPLGVSSVGGVDVLLSAAYLRKISTSDITITPEKSLSIGYGLRVGLLQESLVAPGIGFSILKRSLPVTDLSTSSGTSNFLIDKFDLSSTAWRLTVSKSLLLFGIAAGVGQDKYSASIGGIAATNGGTSVTTPKLTSDVTRTNYFADLSMNLVILKLVATGGMVSGGKIPTYNSFDSAADKSRLYASVGVRFGL